MTRLPSRTYDIARIGLALLAVPLFALVGMMLAGRGELVAILEALGTAMLAIAGVAGAGAGSMGLSNYGSQGLTSSQGPAILAARQAATRTDPARGVAGHGLSPSKAEVDKAESEAENER